MSANIKKCMHPFAMQLIKLGWLKWLILLPFLLCFGIGKGQNIDSLKTKLGKSAGLERIQILSALAYEYVDSDYELCLVTSNEAINLAELYSDSFAIVRLSRIKALAFGRIGQVDSSIQLSEAILPLARRLNYTMEIKHILNRIGAAYSFKAQYDKALKSHYESLELREKSGSPFEISIALNNIGLVYLKLRDYDKALSYYLKCLDMRDEIKDRPSLELLLINTSLCYAYKGEFLKARDFVDEISTLCKKNCSNIMYLHISFCSGVIANGLEDLISAEQHFLSAYKLAKELKDERLLLDNIIFLSEVYLKLNKLNLAEKYLSEAEQLMTADFPYNLELIKVYSGLFTLYSKSGNLKKVAEFQQKYIQLKDSVFSEELTRNLMNVEADYLERENKAKIAAQNEILLLNEKVIFRQRIASAFGFVTAALLIILVAVVVRNNRQQRKTNLSLEQKVKERTKELEINGNVLQQLLEVRDIQVQRMTSSVKSAVATIKGLCAVVKRDPELSSPNLYVNKIEVTSDQLLIALVKTAENSVV